MGYNETMRTRVGRCVILQLCSVSLLRTQVHNNAGSDCILKESMQLNFDEDGIPAYSCGEQRGAQHAARPPAFSSAQNVAFIMRSCQVYNDPGVVASASECSDLESRVAPQSYTPCQKPPWLRRSLRSRLVVPLHLGYRNFLGFLGLLPGACRLDSRGEAFAGLLAVRWRCLGDRCWQCSHAVCAFFQYHRTHRAVSERAIRNFGAVSGALFCYSVACKLVTFRFSLSNAFSSILGGGLLYDTSVRELSAKAQDQSVR